MGLRRRVVIGQRGTYAAIHRLVGPHRRRVAGLAGLSIIGGLLEAGFLVVVTRTALAVANDAASVLLADRFEVDASTAVLVALILVGLRIGIAVAALWLDATISTTVIAALRDELARSFLHAKWAAQEAGPRGRLQELLTTFTQKGAELVNSYTSAVASALNLGAVLIVAVAVSPEGALGVAVMAGILGVILRPVRQVVRRRGRRHSAVSMSLATRLNEISELGLELHVFNAQAAAANLIAKEIDQTRLAHRRVLTAFGLVAPLYTGMAYVALVVALFAAITVDSIDLSSTGAVMLLMLRSLTYGQALQSASASMAASLPFVEELNDQLHEFQQQRLTTGERPLDRVERIELRDVRFSYDGRTEALHDISLTLSRGSIVGIIGPSGSGKSTLVKLLLGLRQPTRGLVLVNGQPLDSYSRSDWARRVSFVPQEARVITGTIAENVMFFRDDVSAQEVERACQLSHLAEDIDNFDSGFSHLIGSGSALSGGQAQRLAIARALVGSPDVLLLDEPTSALDVRSEHLVRETLREFAKERTVVIIAHRLSTLEFCDEILVVQDGTIRDRGRPDELALASRYYRESLEMSGLA